jgi:acyl-CoA synthetase (AMP-forming)/AMP-acid ligase II
MDFPTHRGVPQCTLADYEERFRGRHRVHDAISFWAGRKPQATAIVNASTRAELSWGEFDAATTALAMKLLDMGLGKGDYLAASLSMLTEHILLSYACFKIGVIHAPLDLRLPPAEVLRSLELFRPRAFAFLGSTPAADFRELARAAKTHCPFIEHYIQFSPPEETIEGAVSVYVLAAEARQMRPSQPLLAAYRAAEAAVTENDGAQVIFTTGSTGLPKAALLSHRNITSQNMSLGAAGEFTEATRMLNNLPPSHVAGQSEILMTTLFWGGTAVILHVFDPAKSLQAIQDYQVNKVGQIPARFNLEWRLAGYRDFDLSSVDIAVYGGQQVSRVFLEKLAAMAPRFGTGLGLTEAAGFCTYTRMSESLDEIDGTLGFAMPIYPVSVREPITGTGAAGRELPNGEIGHVCFRGPQTFLGYIDDPEATARAISADGFLYTGDLGHVSERGLHLSGRARWIIKPAGYQVFPGQVENHFSALEEKVASCGVVGAEHAVFSEAIVAFIEKKAGASLEVRELRRHARELPSYMRPLHYVLLDPGQFPLNRVAKTDYVLLSEMARREVARLRAARKWDRQREDPAPSTNR